MTDAAEALDLDAAKEGVKLLLLFKQAREFL